MPKNPTPDDVEVIYVTRKELLDREKECFAELARVRACRSEEEILDELDNISFLLGQS